MTNDTISVGMRLCYRITPEPRKEGEPLRTNIRLLEMRDDDQKSLILKTNQLSFSKANLCCREMWVENVAQHAYYLIENI